MKAALIAAVAARARNFAAGMSGGIAYVLDATARSSRAAITAWWISSALDGGRRGAGCGAIIAAHPRTPAARSPRRLLLDWAADARARSSR